MLRMAYSRFTVGILLVTIHCELGLYRDQVARDAQAAQSRSPRDQRPKFRQ